MLNELKNREDGQTLSEFGIIIFFLVLIVVAAMTFFGENIVAMWDRVVETFDLI
jgi:Flp pilus assembly pilin Flp